MEELLVGGVHAYMQKFLDAEITLIESDEIPTSGVGESSLPQIG